MKTLDDCFKKGLKRIRPDIDSAKRSILTAGRHLKDAEAVYGAKAYTATLISSYEAMFHAARAVLFRDGIKEHSHVCIPVYIRDTYPELEAYANILDSYRILRERAAYGLDVEISEQEAREAVNNARDLLEKMKNIIKIK
jgi:uncharacterized protein (UPF0332 family)